MLAGGRCDEWIECKYVLDMRLASEAGGVSTTRIGVVVPVIIGRESNEQHALLVSRGTKLMIAMDRL